jgi:hypothetical protein
MIRPVETIIGACIALIGVAMAQWVQGRRDERAWKRELEGRYYDRRRDAYVDYLQAFQRLRDAVVRPHPEYTGPPPSELDDVLDPLLNRVDLVRLYGSTEAYQAATRALENLSALIYGDGVPAQTETALETYLRQIRVDLGIERSSRRSLTALTR